MSKKGTKSAKDLRKYNTGDPVLGKMRGYPPWPGIIVDPADVPQAVLDSQPPNKKTSTYCILFFPQGDYGWLSAHDLSFLQRHEIEAFLADETKKRNGDLRSGYRIALDPAGWMTERAAAHARDQEAEENAQVDQLASDAEEGGAAEGGADGEGAEADADGEADADAMDLDVGLGLADGKKGAKKPRATAAAGRKRKRESEAGEGKPAKAKKVAEPKAAKEKKPRKSTARSKAVVESEDDGAAHADEDAADAAPAGSSKKGAKAAAGSPPPNKRARRETREEEDESKSGDAQSVKVRDWRHKLQKTFLSNKGVPKSEAMAEIDALFTTVEQYEEMTIEQLQFSKIGKVMRHIAALDDDKIPPRDADFHFRTRAKGLVDKWHRILNANKSATSAISAGGGGMMSPVSAAPGGRLNGGSREKGKAGDGDGEKTEGEDEKDKAIEEGVTGLDLNGKGADSPAGTVPPTEAAIAAVTTDITVEGATTTTTTTTTTAVAVDAPVPAADAAPEEPLGGAGAADAEGEPDAEAEEVVPAGEDVVMGEA